MTPDNVQFPSLSEPYQTALRSCSDWAFATYDVIAMIATGTIVQGNPDPRSDLDLHVLHRGGFRERVQAFHNGVPCEIFVNPSSRIPQYFAEDAQDRRPMTAHMFATGFVMFDPETIAAGLVALAKQSLASPPPIDPKAIPMYGAATSFEDAEDLAARDPEGALLLLGAVVKDLAVCRMMKEPGWIPRGKDLMASLKKADPESAILASEACDGKIENRIEAAKQLCIRVTGSDGFFEWTSEREMI